MTVTFGQVAGSGPYHAEISALLMAVAGLALFVVAWRLNPCLLRRFLEIYSGLCFGMSALVNIKTAPIMLFPIFSVIISTFRQIRTGTEPAPLTKKTYASLYAFAHATLMEKGLSFFAVASSFAVVYIIDGTAAGRAILPELHVKLFVVMLVVFLGCDVLLPRRVGEKLASLLHLFAGYLIAFPVLFSILRCFMNREAAIRYF